MTKDFFILKDKSIMLIFTYFQVISLIILLIKVNCVTREESISKIGNIITKLFLIDENGIKPFDTAVYFFEKLKYYQHQLLFCL